MTAFALYANKGRESRDWTRLNIKASFLWPFKATQNVGSRELKKGREEKRGPLSHNVKVNFFLSYLGKEKVARRISEKRSALYGSQSGPGRQKKSRRKIQSGEKNGTLYHRLQLLLEDIKCVSLSWNKIPRGGATLTLRKNFYRTRFGPSKVDPFLGQRSHLRGRKVGKSSQVHLSRSQEGKKCECKGKACSVWRRQLRGFYASARRPLSEAARSEVDTTLTVLRSEKKAWK